MKKFRLNNGKTKDTGRLKNQISQRQKPKLIQAKKTQFKLNFPEVELFEDVADLLAELRYICKKNDYYIDSESFRLCYVLYVGARAVRTAETSQKHPFVSFSNFQDLIHNAHNKQGISAELHKEKKIYKHLFKNNRTPFKLHDKITIATFDNRSYLNGSNFDELMRKLWKERPLSIFPTDVFASLYIDGYKPSQNGFEKLLLIWKFGVHPIPLPVRKVIINLIKTGEPNFYSTILDYEEAIKKDISDEAVRVYTLKEDN